MLGEWEGHKGRLRSSDDGKNPLKLVSRSQALSKSFSHSGNIGLATGIMICFSRHWSRLLL